MHHNGKGVVAGTQGTWAQRIHIQGAERDECWCARLLLLSFLSYPVQSPQKIQDAKQVFPPQLHLSGNALTDVPSGASSQ